MSHFPPSYDDFLWTTRPCFQIWHWLLVSSDFQPNTRYIIFKVPFFRNAKVVQNRKDKSHIFFKVSIRRQDRLLLYQVTQKACGMV